MFSLLQLPSLTEFLLCSRHCPKHYYFYILKGSSLRPLFTDSKLRTGKINKVGQGHKTRKREPELNQFYLIPPPTFCRLCSKKSCSLSKISKSAAYQEKDILWTLTNAVCQRWTNAAIWNK